MRPRGLDHLALVVPDRQSTAELLCDQLSVRVLERSHGHTTLGASADAGKIVLCDAPPGRLAGPGRLISVLLADPGGSGREPLLLAGGVAITFAMHERVPHDIPQHAVIGASLRSSDPAIVAADYVARFGLEPVVAHRDVATVAAGSGTITLVRESLPELATGVLAHIGLLVDCADEQDRAARELGLQLLERADDPARRGIALVGPEGITIEYVEPMPQVALV